MTRYRIEGDQVARFVGAKTMAIALALLMPADALAQSRTFYGADGRVAGRATTDSAGSTTIYDASGRVTGRTSTSGNTTTIYDASGRKTGSITITKKPMSK